MVKCGVVGWSRVTKNGQVTLPRGIRDKLDVEAGEDLVQFLLTDNENVLVRKFTLNESVEV